MNLLGKIQLVAVLLILSALPANAQPSLVIATNDYPPYATSSTDQNFLADLFAEIGTQMGVRFEFHYLPWKRCEQEVADATAWGTIPYRKTASREKAFLFSDPIYLADSHFFAYSANGTKPPITYEKLSDLQPYKIGGIQGYYYEPWFEKAGLDVQYAHSEEQNFKRLQLGRIDLFSTATTVGWHLINTQFPPEEAAKFYTLEKPLIAGEGLFLMTSKDYPETYALLPRFNAALAVIKENGTYKRLINQYGLIMTY
ncbi:substrate-binding periplasmic protein [Thalassospira mesophila]|uniref:ABC transporter substrate-binding protein n=1 Tax=Thalassospira mesophila TaxID=1293891 RepID=A0A1Y2L2V6_9PROT|nr:transporter substrate-binding domain-containing protein [Thalassospira mesophila]OSQ39811.1 ABC transporter substrate-binding protein [Thalassospira mesophila]